MTLTASCDKNNRHRTIPSEMIRGMPSPLPLPPIPLLPKANKRTHFIRNGVLALFMALLCALVWKPLFLLSLGFVAAAFVMAIVAIVKGRTLSGSLLMAACPFVMFGAFSWFTSPGDLIDETRKQRRERYRTEERSKKEAPSESYVTNNQSPLTPSEANYINTFARKHDMKVARVMRWEYVLSRRGLNLRDYDEALTRLGASTDKVLGYHIVRPRQNLESRLVEEGERRPQQDSRLTSDEEAIVKTLKAAGY